MTSEDDPQVLCLKHAVEHIREKGSPEGFRILSRDDTVSTGCNVSNTRDSVSSGYSNTENRAIQALSLASSQACH